jgi:hypothetical protein
MEIILFFLACLFVGSSFFFKMNFSKVNYFLIFGSVMKSKLENNF